VEVEGAEGDRKAGGVATCVLEESERESGKELTSSAGEEKQEAQVGDELESLGRVVRSPSAGSSACWFEWFASVAKTMHGSKAQQGRLTPCGWLHESPTNIIA
jgi:hypothetical protein